MEKYLRLKEINELIKNNYKIDFDVLERKKWYRWLSSYKTPASVNVRTMGANKNRSYHIDDVTKILQVNKRNIENYIKRETELVDNPFKKLKEFEDPYLIRRLIFMGKISDSDKIENWKIKKYQKIVAEHGNGVQEFLNEEIERHELNFEEYRNKIIQQIIEQVDFDAVREDYYDLVEGNIVNFERIDNPLLYLKNTES